MTQKMRQVQMNEYGSAEVLELIESEIPKALPGQVIVQVEAIGVNYSDILRRENNYFMPTPLPYVLGSEVVGRIVSSGKGVTEPFVEGARVLAILPNGGGYSEYVEAIAQYCVPLPDHIDAKSATGIFVQGSTAQLMISDVAKNVEGKTVLINAAAGGVGSILVQLAKMNGAKVIAAGSSDVKLIAAKANGADHTVNYSDKDWSRQVIEANDGNGVDFVFEMVGGEVYNESIKALAEGGKIIVYGCVSGVQGSIHPEHFVDVNISQSGFNLAYYLNNKMEVWQNALGTIIGLLAENKLQISTPNTFNLREAAEAHKMIEARKTTGKVVLTTNN